MDKNIVPVTGLTPGSSKSRLRTGMFPGSNGVEVNGYPEKLFLN